MNKEQLTKLRSETIEEIKKEKNTLDIKFRNLIKALYTSKYETDITTDISVKFEQEKEKYNYIRLTIYFPQNDEFASEIEIVRNEKGELKLDSSSYSSMSDVRIERYIILGKIAESYYQLKDFLNKFDLSRYNNLKLELMEIDSQLRAIKHEKEEATRNESKLEFITNFLQVGKQFTINNWYGNQGNYKIVKLTPKFVYTESLGYMSQSKRFPVEELGSHYANNPAENIVEIKQQQQQQ